MIFAIEERNGGVSLWGTNHSEWYARKTLKRVRGLGYRVLSWYSGEDIFCEYLRWVWFFDRFGETPKCSENDLKLARKLFGFRKANRPGHKKNLIIRQLNALNRELMAMSSEPFSYGA
jgi:hypothetical protein